MNTWTHMHIKASLQRVAHFITCISLIYSSFWGLFVIVKNTPTFSGNILLLLLYFQSFLIWKFWTKRNMIILLLFCVYLDSYRNVIIWIIDLFSSEWNFHLITYLHLSMNSMYLFNSALFFLLGSVLFYPGQQNRKFCFLLIEL